MFVKCFSDDLLEEAYWPASFYYENTIRAILIEDGVELRGLSAEITQREILRIGQGMGFPHSCPEPIPTDSWVARFFERECPNLVAFLNQVLEGECSTIDPDDSRLAINEERLQECVRLSHDFRRFLTNAKTIWGN